jgi:hypothetical protein
MYSKGCLAMDTLPQLYFPLLAVRRHHRLLKVVLPHPFTDAFFYNLCFIQFNERCFGKKFKY